MRTKRNYLHAIREILRFKKAITPFDSKIPRKLVGEIGEYYVCYELLSRGYNIVPKGGQGGYDIFLSEIGKRIEVRTSLLKNEGVYPKDIDFYGWRVRNRDQKADNKFDYLIGVALDDSYKNPQYYVFTYKEAFSVGDVDIGRFKNVQKKIYIFNDLRIMKRAIKCKPKLITKYERFINMNKRKFLDKWSKIK